MATELLIMRSRGVVSRGEGIPCDFGQIWGSTSIPAECKSCTLFLTAAAMIANSPPGWPFGWSDEELGEVCSKQEIARHGWEPGETGVCPPHEGLDPG